jgi:3-dehydroquinate synthase
LRSVLNFGHTIGHAIEAAGRFRRFHHGEAVAVGMIAETALARRLGMGRPGEETRLRGLIGQVGLPTRVRGLDRDRIFYHLRFDKKAKSGRLRFALPESIGKVQFPVEAPRALVEEAIDDVIRP